MNINKDNNKLIYYIVILGFSLMGLVALEWMMSIYQVKTYNVCLTMCKVWNTNMRISKHQYIQYQQVSNMLCVVWDGGEVPLTLAWRKPSFFDLTLKYIRELRIPQFFTTTYPQHTTRYCSINNAMLSAFFLFTITRV